MNLMDVRFAGRILLAAGLALAALMPMGSGVGRAAPAQAPQQNFTAVDFVSPAVGWVAKPSAILATRNGGRSWTRQYANPGQVLELGFVSARIGWAVTTRRLLGTTDGGGHWRTLGEPGTPLLSVDFLNAAHGWGIAEVAHPYVAGGPSVATRHGRLVRTNNGGRTWTVASAPAAQSVCFSSAQRGWAADANTVYSTTNGGAHWRAILRAPLAHPRGWTTDVHCAGGNVWTVMVGQDVAMMQVAQIAYHLTATGWRPAFDEGYFSHGDYPYARLPQTPASYPGPFTVVPGGAFFTGVNPAVGPHGAVGFARALGNNYRPVRQALPGLSAAGSIAISFSDARHGWVAGQSGAGPTLLATGDGGDTWRMLHP